MHHMCGIVTLEQSRFADYLGQGIREAVPEIQTCDMPAPTILRYATRAISIGPESTGTSSSFERIRKR